MITALLPAVFLAILLLTVIEADVRRERAAQARANQQAKEQQ